MPETPLTLTIDTEHLTPQRLSGILREFTGLLREIDEELSPSAARSLDWRITGLSYSSPAAIAMVAVPRGEAPDIGRPVVSACIGGVALLSGERARPSEFNDDALLHLRQIAEWTNGDIRAVRVESPTVPAPASITRELTTTVEWVLPQGYSLGSVEGQLQGLNIHTQPRFTVYDAVTGRAVRCYFSAADLDAVKDAIGRKVIVSGRLRRDPGGRPQQVRRIEFFEPIDDVPETPPPDAAGLFQGLGDARSYLEMIRGE